MRLIVGDPHVRPDNIEESKKLIEFIAENARSRGVTHIVFLGDLFHTHRVIRMEVQKFWLWAAQYLLEISTVICVTGNHDQPGDIRGETEMSALDTLRFLSNVKVIDSPVKIGNTTYLPHTADSEKFYEWVSKSKTPYLVCHQTFNGAQYENGFYSEDGLNVESMSKFDLVISGHIHKQQRFANIFYPGTPRWDSISDANEEKGIWLFSDNGSWEFISTKNVCRPLVSFEIKEGEEIPTIEPGARVHIKLTGSSAWIAATSKKLKGLVKISSKPTDTRFSSSDRKLSSIEEYAANFKFDLEIDSKDVIEYLRSLT